MRLTIWRSHATCKLKEKRLGARTSWAMWWSMITWGDPWSIDFSATPCLKSTATPRRICLFNSLAEKLMLATWGASPLLTLKRIYLMSRKNGSTKFLRPETKSSERWRKDLASLNKLTLRCSISKIAWTMEMSRRFPRKSEWWNLNRSCPPSTKTNIKTKRGIWRPQSNSVFQIWKTKGVTCCRRPRWISLFQSTKGARVYSMMKGPRCHDRTGNLLWKQFTKRRRTWRCEDVFGDRMLF